MSTPIDDPDDPCYFASRASSASCCAYWCARAIAQWTTRNAVGAQRESDYNVAVESLQKKLLVMIEAEETSREV